ncbi:hypothetical protein ACOSP7_032325 [Xanthoceras sorbifolium]
MMKSRITLVRFALVLLLLCSLSAFQCSLISRDLKVSNIGGKVMVVEDDDRMEKNDYGSAGGDYGGAPPQDDDGNYYRRQGDVPSPGVGH